MDQPIRKHNKCRVCATPLDRLLNLGTHFISDFITEPNEPRHPAVPLILTQCPTCKLVQLRDTVPRDWMYKENYWYKSGVNESMVEALKDVVISACCYVDLTENDTVLDIGANDGTLLSLYAALDKKPQRIGVEPATNLHTELSQHCEMMVPDYWPPHVRYDGQKAKIITTIAMFYDLDDPNAFVAEIKRVLHHEGIWVIQLGDLGSMIRQNAFDAICHEHLEYYSLESLSYLLQKHDLVPIMCAENAVNGGSLRVYVTHRERGLDSHSSIAQQRLAESDQKLNASATWHQFSSTVLDIRDSVRQYVMSEVKKGHPVDVYGASTKGNTLLQYFGLDSTLIRRAIERSPDKWGKFTVGTNIPIVPEEQGRRAAAKLWIVPIWHFRESVVAREQEFLHAGGQMLFPLPWPSLVGPDNG